MNKYIRNIVYAAIAIVVIFLEYSCDSINHNVEYFDFLTNGKINDTLKPSIRSIHDETYLTLELNCDIDLTAEAELSSVPELTVETCVQSNAEQAMLILSIENVDMPDQSLEVIVQPLCEWTTRSIDLSRFAHQNIRLVVRLEGSKGACAYIRELYIRQLICPKIEQSESPDHILLVSIDTLRCDMVLNDQGKYLTPNISNLVKESEVWDYCYAAASWTKPSHASLLTGYYPLTHRALSVEDAIDKAVPTLAERMRCLDIITASQVYDCLWLDPKWGFDRGFDEYSVVQWRVDRQIRSAINWLQEHRYESFFYFLHTFEPHSDSHALPYESPGINRTLIQQEYGFRDYGCRGNYCASAMLKAYNERILIPRPNEPELLKELYKNSVMATDKALGRLIEDLRESGLWDNLLFIVTSDHGEEFGEHGNYLHNTLYESVIRVPLIVKWPKNRRRGKHISVPVSAIDVVPTILGYVGKGDDTLPGWPLGERPEHEPIFAGTRARAMILDGKKIHPAGAERNKLLFDLNKDPDENDNLASSRPDEFKQLKHLLAEYSRRDVALWQSFQTEGQVTPPDRLSEEEKIRLRDLGYLE